MTAMASEQADGSSETIHRARRPCAVSVADEAPQLLPLANALRDAVEHLGRVAARLALNRCDERDLLDVAVLHALDDAVERVLERDAELLVGDHALELGLRGLRRVGHDDGEARRRGCAPRAGRRRARRGCPGAGRRTPRRLRAILPR